MPTLWHQSLLTEYLNLSGAFHIRPEVKRQIELLASVPLMYFLLPPSLPACLSLQICDILRMNIFCLFVFLNCLDFSFHDIMRGSVCLSCGLCLKMEAKVEKSESTACGDQSPPPVINFCTVNHLQQV